MGLSPGLIFACLVFFVVRQWNELPDFDWRFEPAWLALSALGVFGFYVFQGEIWRLIVHSLGESHLRARPARAIWGKSLLARYVPTNALMVVGRIVMAEQEGVPKRVTLASIVYELVLGFGTAVMVGAYFVIQLPDLDDQPARYAVLLLIPIVLAVLHPRVFAPLANFGLRKLGREPLPQVLPFAQVLKFSLMYIGCWAVIGLGLFAFATALHPLDGSDLPYVAASYPVAFCVAVLTFVVPSGLGTRDAALAMAMAAVLAGRGHGDRRGRSASSRRRSSWPTWPSSWRWTGSSADRAGSVDKAGPGVSAKAPVAAAGALARTLQRLVLGAGARRPRRAWGRRVVGRALGRRLVEARVVAPVVLAAGGVVARVLVGLLAARRRRRRSRSRSCPVLAYLPKKGENVRGLGGQRERRRSRRRGRRSCSRARSRRGRCRRPR